MTALTKLECTIARLVSEGLWNKDIAMRIGRTEYATKERLRKIFDKLGFHNRVELALWYIYETEGKEDRPYGCVVVHSGTRAPLLATVVDVADRSVR